MSSDILKTQTPAYTDIAGLSKLKRAAGADDPKAIRTVAEQFEAMFTRMMLKSMRDAVGPDPMFGSDQEQMYQGMADDQLSVQLAKGKGLGLADMLVRQLQKMGVNGANGASGAAGSGAGANGATPGAGTPGASGFALGAKAAAAYRATQQASPTPTTSATSDSTKSHFIQDLWPQAQDAGTLLGVDPRHLIAQAALETNWGQSLPQDASGRSSNNLFGMKASSDWTGGTVTNGTQEFANGAASSTTAQFKAYATPTQSFQDYVALLRNNPRYSSALNTGSDVHAFGAALQRSGYATDPEYANKIAAVANTVGNLKLSSTLPIPEKAGTL